MQDQHALEQWTRDVDWHENVVEASVGEEQQWRSGLEAAQQRENEEDAWQSWVHTEASMWHGFDMSNFAIHPCFNANGEEQDWGEYSTCDNATQANDGTEQAWGNTEHEMCTALHWSITHPNDIDWTATAAEPCTQAVEAEQVWGNTEQELMWNGSDWTTMDAVDVGRQWGRADYPPPHEFEWSDALAHACTNDGTQQWGDAECGSGLATVWSDRPPKRDEDEAEQQYQQLEDHLMRNDIDWTATAAEPCTQAGEAEQLWGNTEQELMWNGSDWNTMDAVDVERQWGSADYPLPHEFEW
eukprot:3452560-Amphidinium_carterae.1